MDRPISNAERVGHRVRPVLVILAVIVAVFVLSRFALGLMRPNLEADDLRTAVVERGPVMAAVETTGLLVPAGETVLTAPTQTRVLEVLRRPGSTVKQGDPILTLDTTELELERAGFEQQLALRRNQVQQAELRYQQAAKETRRDLDLTELDIRFRATRHKQQQQLHDQGLASLEDLQQAELEWERLKVEKRQLKESLDDRKVVRDAEIKGLNLEIDLLNRSLQQAEAELARATTKAPADGVLTWVVEAEGSTLAAGQPLARIADLSTFNVRASISDLYAGRLFEGQKARIRLDELEMEGTLERVRPEIEQGTLNFDLSFIPHPNARLRSNQRVEVFLETAHRDDVLRVKRGASLPGNGEFTVFVVEGKQAAARRVTAGVSGMGFVEVIKGLREGDKLILNELRDMDHLDSIPIK